MTLPGAKYPPRPRVPGIILSACLDALPGMVEPFTPADLWREVQNRLEKPPTREQLNAGLGDCLHWLRQHSRIVALGAGKYIRGGGQ